MLSIYSTGSRPPSFHDSELVYRQLTIDDELFTARVYKRNYRPKVKQTQRKPPPPALLLGRRLADASLSATGDSVPIHRLPSGKPAFEAGQDNHEVSCLSTGEQTGGYGDISYRTHGLYIEDSSVSRTNYEYNRLSRYDLLEQFPTSLWTLSPDLDSTDVINVQGPAVSLDLVYRDINSRQLGTICHSVARCQPDNLKHLLHLLHGKFSRWRQWYVLEACIQKRFDLMQLLLNDDKGLIRCLLGVHQALTLNFRTAVETNLIDFIRNFIHNKKEEASFGDITMDDIAREFINDPMVFTNRLLKGRLPEKIKALLLFRAYDTAESKLLRLLCTEVRKTEEMDLMMQVLLRQASTNPNIEIFRSLLTYGLPPPKDLLFSAAKRLDQHLLELLLIHGCNANQTTPSQTNLFLEVASRVSAGTDTKADVDRAISCINILLAHGADITVMTCNCRKFYHHIAYFPSDFPIADYLHSIEVDKASIGIARYARDRNGYIPKNIAKISSHGNILDFVHDVEASFSMEINSDGSLDWENFSRRGFDRNSFQISLIGEKPFWKTAKEVRKMGSGKEGQPKAFGEEDQSNQEPNGDELEKKELIGEGTSKQITTESRLVEDISLQVDGPDNLFDPERSKENIPGEEYLGKDSYKENLLGEGHSSKEPLNRNQSERGLSMQHLAREENYEAEHHEHVTSTGEQSHGSRPRHSYPATCIPQMNHQEEKRYRDDPSKEEIPPRHPARESMPGDSVL